jgi:hypothetical protein
MKLADLVPDGNGLIAMAPEQLGEAILRVLADWPKAEAVQLSRFLSISRSQYPPSLTRQVHIALMTAWAGLEGQALLIPDTRYGEGVLMLSARAHKLVKKPVTPIGDIMADDDQISEAGAKARFARWDEIGLDRIKSDLLNGGHQLVGGPPAVRALAWKWVRMKEAEQATTPDGPSDSSILIPGAGGPLSPGYRDAPSRTFRVNYPPLVSDVPPQAATPPAQKPAELFTLRPGIWGMSVDLKEVGRRSLNWLRGLI